MRQGKHTNPSAHNDNSPKPLKRVSFNKEARGREFPKGGSAIIEQNSFVFEANREKNEPFQKVPGFTDKKASEIATQRRRVAEKKSEADKKLKEQYTAISPRLGEIYGQEDFYEQLQKLISKREISHEQLESLKKVIARERMRKLSSSNSLLTENKTSFGLVTHIAERPLKTIFISAATTFMALSIPVFGISASASTALSNIAASINSMPILAGAINVVASHAMARDATVAIITGTAAWGAAYTLNKTEKYRTKQAAETQRS